MPNRRAADQVAVTVYLSRDLKRALTERARQTGETVTAVFTRAAEQYTTTDRQ